MGSTEAALTIFESHQHWDAFERLAQAQRLVIIEVSRWLARNAVRANYQIAHRAGHVVDSTAIEQYFSVLRGQLAGRRGAFGNRERLNRLLMLMMLQQRSAARIRHLRRISPSFSKQGV